MRRIDKIILYCSATLPGQRVDVETITRWHKERGFKTIGYHFFIDRSDGRILLNEINTIPGSPAFYLWEATGLKYPDLLDELIRLALKREREEEKLNFSFDTNILSGVSLGGAKGKA